MLFTASATFLLTFFILPGTAEPDPALQADLQRILEVREMIAHRFVGEYDESALTHAALVATVQALGDPWSRYLTQEEYEAHLRRMGNRHQGIGINFLRHEDSNEMLVISVTLGSPAEEAGLVPGDTIVSLQGQFTGDLETEVIQQMVTDQLDNFVTLDVRDEAGEMRTIRVYVREFFAIPVVYEMKEGNIGYIRIINFDQGSDSATEAAIANLRNAGARGLIFDVRSNPGGRLHDFLNIINFLVPEGEIFVYEDQNGVEHVRHSDSNYIKMPMVVLVDQNSYSAAELFAAVLQEYDWATIVGTATTGKSRVQNTIPLSTGSALHLSVSRYLTPGRVDLYESGGVQPDYVVELEDGGVDNQMEKALEIIERLIANF